MTEQLTNRRRENHTVRNIFLVAGLAAGTFAAGGILADGNKSGSLYNSQTTAEVATPGTSEAGASPSGSPEPSSSPEASTVAIQNIEVKELTTYAVLPGDFIPGDVSMSDSADSAVFPLYDTDTHKAADVTDNTKTALYVDVQAQGVVHAVYGDITVIRGMTAEQKAEFLKDDTASKLRSGFSKVDVVLWTGYDTTVDEAGYKADGTLSTTPVVSPSESPAATTIDNINNMSLSAQEKATIVLNILNTDTNLTSADKLGLLELLAACMCGCGTPEAPTPTPTPKPTQEPVCVPMDDHFMKKGETFKVNGKDFIVQGDVFIDGVRHFDNSGKTGAIDEVLDGKSHTIVAPYGADVQEFNACATDANINDLYNKDLSQLKASGRTLDKLSLKKN